jgi:hypothetical protein
MLHRLTRIQKAPAACCRDPTELKRCCGTCAGEPGTSVRGFRSISALGPRAEGLNGASSGAPPADNRRSVTIPLISPAGAGEQPWVGAGLRRHALTWEFYARVASLNGWLPLRLPDTLPNVRAALRRERSEVLKHDREHDRDAQRRGTEQVRFLSDTGGNTRPISIAQLWCCALD